MHNGIANAAEDPIEQAERREFIMAAPKGLDFTLSKADGRKFVYSNTESHWKEWKSIHADSTLR